jgi:serine/threonine-protein kinase
MHCTLRAGVVSSWWVGTCTACGATYDGEAHDCSREKRTARLRPSDPDANEPADELIGRRLGGYVVDRVVGKGGMGVVYRATHPVLGKHVAVKVIRSEHAADEDFRRRFMDEARVLAALDDPRIVAIQDLALLPDGRAYLVMEFVDGELLSDRIAAGRVPPAEALRIVRELCAGLSAAHARGIVHRDIKPSNVVLTGERVTLLDFGLAKLRDRPGGAASRAGAVIGTPGYMPPEQASAAAELGPTADVYAVGVVFYELLAGRRPFDDGAAASDDWVEILVRQRTHEPAPIDGAPRAFEAVVRRALARAPADRYADAGAMLAALPSAAAAVRPGRRGGAILATIGIAGLGVAGVTAWRIASSGSSEAPATTPAPAPAPAPVAHEPPPAPAKPAPPAAAPAGPIPGATSLGSGNYGLPAPADLAHFDASGYLPTATALMRDLLPDAELISMTATQVEPDANVDLRPSGSSATYWFRSPAASQPPPGQLKGRALTCRGAVTVDKKQVLVQPITIAACDDLTFVPRCTVQQVLARARAQGAPTDAIAYVSVERSDKWTIDRAHCAAEKDTHWDYPYCEFERPTAVWALSFPKHSFGIPDTCGAP